MNQPRADCMRIWSESESLSLRLDIVANESPANKAAARGAKAKLSCECRFMTASRWIDRRVADDIRYGPSRSAQKQLGHATVRRAWRMEGIVGLAKLHRRNSIANVQLRKF